MVMASVVVLAAAILVPTLISNLLYASRWHDIVMLTGTDDHVVGLRSDGTVVASGWNHRSQCEVADWEDVVQVAAGGYFTAGLKSDGTVVVASTKGGFTDVYKWTNVVSICADRNHLLALTEDDTCLAVEIGDDGADEVERFENVKSIYAVRKNNINASLALTYDGHLYLTGGWGEIAQEVEEMTGSEEGMLQVAEVYDVGTGLVIAGVDGSCYLLTLGKGQSFTLLEGWDSRDIVDAIGGSNTLEVLKNGIVKYVGTNTVMKETVAEWTDIVAMDGRWQHVLGLRDDGTVVAAGMNEYGQCEVEDWKDITQIFTLDDTSFGVKEDGSVVACGFDPYDMTYVTSKNPIELLQFWWSATTWDSMVN